MSFCLRKRHSICLFLFFCLRMTQYLFFFCFPLSGVCPQNTLPKAMLMKVFTSIFASNHHERCSR